MMRSLAARTGSLRSFKAAQLLMSQQRFGSGKNKFVTAEDAAWLVENNQTITVGGFVSQGAPEEVLRALGQRFKETGGPTGLTLVFGGGPGDWDSRGVNHISHEGLIRRAVGAHYGQVPRLAKLAQENLIEAYNLPLGSISRMIRCAAANQPGHITTVGFGTAVDPKLAGGKINEITKDDLVIEVEIEGTKYLMYKAIPIDVALVRGTTGDADGNITMEKESLYVDHMIQAMSARSTRGTVIAQVERRGARGTLHPRAVRIPGTMVDACVIASPENHYMSFVTPYNPAASAEIRQPMTFGTTPLDTRKMIARRAALELAPAQVINLGIGMPEGIAEVCSEEEVLNFVELTTEPGVHGGVGLSGHDFGPAVNYDALLEMHSQFDFYNGGGLDAAFLGMAEVDQNGDVNVTRVGPKLTGPGGFIDISQSTRRVSMLGTFTAGGLKCAVKDKKLVIEKEGKVKKFVSKVKEVTFSGDQARKRAQVIHYITERAVFSLSKKGMELVEVAPGIDVQTQILDLMDFKPIISPNLQEMNPQIFVDTLMGLKELNFVMRDEDRFSYDKAANTVYTNLNHFHIKTESDINQLIRVYREFFRKNAPGKAHVVVNYDDFEIPAALTPLWERVAKEMANEFYLSVRRYTTRTFAQHRLRQSISIDDARDFTLPEVQAFVRQHGLLVSDDTVKIIFAKCLSERQESAGSKDIKTLDKKCLEKLVERIMKRKNQEQKQ